MTTDEFELASPCVGVCLMDPDDGLCMGCYRTIEEIAAWGELPRDGHMEILTRLRERRAAAGQDRRRINARRSGTPS